MIAKMAAVPFCRAVSFRRIPSRISASVRSGGMRVQRMISGSVQASTMNETPASSQGRRVMAPSHSGASGGVIAPLVFIPAIVACSPGGVAPPGEPNEGATFERHRLCDVPPTIVTIRTEVQ